MGVSGNKKMELLYHNIKRSLKLSDVLIHFWSLKQTFYILIYCCASGIPFSVAPSIMSENVKEARACVSPKPCNIIFALE